MSCRNRVILLLLAAPAAAQEITVATLAAEIGSLEAVAFVPAVTFSARQFSSYDRRSVDPAKATDDGWFANGDQGQFVRVEERDGKPEYVMADAHGPGAVTRIWSADPKGILRVYLDGAAKPQIEEPFDKLLGGKHQLAKDPLAGVRARGWNLHLPIPYAKHLKITVDEKRVYYHVNVRTYPEGTGVRSWSPDEMRAAGESLDAAALRLRRRGPPAAPPQAPAFGGFRWAELGPGEARSWSVSPGRPGMVTGVLVRLSAKGDTRRAWRSVLIRGSFDGEVCIDAPLSDFFGAGPEPQAYDSAAAGVTRDGTAWSRWVMPFLTACELNFVNHGSKVALDFGVIVEDLPSGVRPRHFHANWRQQLDFPTRPRQDWNALSVEGGAGAYVGCALSIANPVKDWWGEGDEKMFVDGETFPSTFGTGTEDFFGYAWCSPEPFQHSLHGQPRCDGPGNRGFASVYRWQLADRVPWTRSFRFDLEVWHWKSCTISQAMTVYWYGDPGVRAAFPPLDAKALAIPVLRIPEAKVVAGAIEGESMAVLEKTGRADAQDLSSFGEGRWSGDAQLWWRDAKAGDRLVLGFPAPRAGRFRVLAGFTMAPDYGIHRIAIAGRPAGDSRDFHDPRVVPSGEIDLGVFDLREGRNTFEVVATGANPRAVPSLMFGLDYVRLVEAP